MPLYDVRCPGCGAVTEQILKRDETPAECACGETPERETVQLPNFALKGGGWYKDGYSKGSGGTR